MEYLLPGKKHQLKVILSLLVVAVCECQEEVCGTKPSEAIDLMWIIDHSSGQENSTVIVSKFLSDMILWFKIASSDMNGTTHGCLVYSDTLEFLSQYELSVTNAQQNFMNLKNLNTSNSHLNKALEYLATFPLGSDRKTIPNVAVIITDGQSSRTAQAITEVAKLAELGWDVISVGITDKENRNKIESISSQPHVENQNYHIVESLAELGSLEFQEKLAKKICSRQNVPSGYLNVARNKEATQSSTVAQGYSYLAVDGIRNSSFAHGSCSHTGTGLNQKNWWQVDLEKPHDIRYVSILNREKHSERLKYFNVICHNRKINNVLYDSEYCATQGEVPIRKGATKTYRCKQLQNPKRYVMVRQYQYFADNYLSVCEVEVLTECPNGTSGMNCSKTCSINCIGTCDKPSGSCEACKDGFTGFNCEKKCPKTCDACNQKFGNCSNCVAGFTGSKCECSINCKDGICDPLSGECLQCKAGFTGTVCEKPCPPKCDSVCDQISGNCIACESGFTGPQCTEDCPENCDSGCDQRHGDCVHCKPGYFLYRCESECPPGRYGPNCYFHCSEHCNDDCEPETGNCKECKPGYMGSKCDQSLPAGQYLRESSKNLMIVSLVAIMVVAVMAGVGVYMFIKRKQGSDTGFEDISELTQCETGSVSSLSDEEDEISTAPYGTEHETTSDDISDSEK